ncbi:MAG: hypothetical protein ACXV8O_09330, partial [Methylobacter sp.]
MTARTIIRWITEFIITPADGKTKNDHFKDMLVNAIADKGLKAKTVLFDSWYASWENLKLVHSLKRTFYITLKSNRMVSLRLYASRCHR